MTKTRRRVLIAFCLAAAVALGLVGLGLWGWWPDATKLTRYASTGDASGVRLCLFLGVGPNEPSRYGWKRHAEGQTPLTAAAEGGHVEVIRILLEGGADPNLLDFGGRWPHETPLSMAAIFGHVYACQVLLDAGADPNKATNPGQTGDPGGWTALDWALQADQSQVAELLKAHGAVESGKRKGEE